MSIDVGIRGIAHGKMIELEQDSGLPEGQSVVVVVKPVQAAAMPGEGLRESFGGWADEAEELDKYLEWSRKQRKVNRREIDL